jgi:hypothetical protein
MHFQLPAQDYGANKIVERRDEDARRDQKHKSQSDIAARRNEYAHREPHKRSPHHGNERRDGGEHSEHQVVPEAEYEAQNEHHKPLKEGNEKISFDKLPARFPQFAHEKASVLRVNGHHGNKGFAKRISIHQ